MDRKTYTGTITHLEPNQIFVFGSNTQGRHGKGAALTAVRFGAVYGRSSGLMGQSYGIITKNLLLRSHPSIPEFMIVSQIGQLYEYAEGLPNHEFLIAYKGYGDVDKILLPLIPEEKRAIAATANLNGYTPAQMATMFIKADTHIPANIIFEKSFWELIQSKL